MSKIIIEKMTRLCITARLIYRTCAIISRGLYFFYPFFTKAAAYTADNLCKKQGNVGIKSVAYKQERIMMARVRYSESICKQSSQVKST
jgi:hypothetical protein